MKNQFFKIILSFIFLICAVKANAQNIQAHAALQQYTIRIGDQTRLFISVHKPVKAQVIFPKLTDTVSSKIQIVTVNKPDTAYDKNEPGAVTVTQSYLIACFDAGTYVIPQFSFKSANGIIKTHELTLQVETVKVDTTKAIYDIKQPMAVTYTFFDWLHDNWYWIVIPLAIIGLITGATIYLKKRPKIEPARHVAVPFVPPHFVALNQLKELRDKKLWQQGEVKDYYVGLSEIIREYLEKRYTIKTHEKTTDEIITALIYAKLDDDEKNKLKQLLVLADMVKFAKEKPLPADNAQAMEIAIDFVEMTKQVVHISEKEGGNTDV